MTEKQQKKFYFPAWRRCAEVNDWVMAGSRLQADLVAQRRQFEGWPEPARSAALKLLDYAEALAQQEHRGVTATDLRHGCNLVVTQGREHHSEPLTNQETNRVVVLFQLLQDPDNLDAVMEWENPDLADKRSLVSYIRKCAPEGTLVAIWRNAYGNIFWEDGDLQQLRWLLKQVKGRRERFHREAVCPF